MDMNLLVGLGVALLLIADVVYLYRQHKRGISTCGCSCGGCSCDTGSCGCGCGGPNVAIDEGPSEDAGTGERKGRRGAPPPGRARLAPLIFNRT